MTACGCPVVVQIAGQALIAGVVSMASNIGTQLVEGNEKIDLVDAAIDGAISAGCSLIGSAFVKKASDVAENTIKKGINRIVSGLDSYKNGSRYYKGAMKRGMETLKRGITTLNTAQGTASVIGSAFNGVGSTAKTFIKSIFAN